MNFITRGLNKLKSNSIYRDRGFDFDRETTTVDEINQLALSNTSEDKLLAFDYLRYNYYYSPCAYTASNLIAGYVDLMQSELELSEGVMSFEEIEGVGKYLEKASGFSDVFDSKEYFVSLAQFKLLQSVDNIDKAFNILNGIPTAFIDEEVQYLTGALYFLLGMRDIAVKMLEPALGSDKVEVKSSASLMIAKSKEGIEDNEKAELLKSALCSKKTAVITEAIAMLALMNRSDIIADIEPKSLALAMNGELCKALASAYKSEKKADSLSELKELVEDNEIYTAIVEGVIEGREFTVDEIEIEINQRYIEDITDSEMYKTSDVYTRRMLNNEIMETVAGEESFSEIDYIELIPTYVK